MEVIVVSINNEATGRPERANSEPLAACLIRSWRGAKGKELADRCHERRNTIKLEKDTGN